MSNINYLTITRQERKDLLKQSNGYCFECQKPIKTTHILCFKCTKSIKVTGLSNFKISVGDVGKRTINYQQYLHRTFFGCNANYKYRGNKEDRVRTKIKKNHIQELLPRIDKLLDTYFKELYSKSNQIKNIKERVLYELTLYHIDYYILKSNYDSELHFKSTIIRRIQAILIKYLKFNNIEIDRTCYIHSIKLPQYRTLTKEIENIMSNILLLIT